MISTPTPSLDELFSGPDHAELREQIRRQDIAHARELLERFTRPVPSGEPWQWACDNLFIKTPTVNAPFQPIGREYMREPINNINNDEVAEDTCCWGTGNGKTTKHVAQITWAMENDPFSGLYVLPSKEGPGGARKFSTGILIPTLERTKGLREKLPTGAQRDKLTGLHIEFGGNDIDLVGANSPTQLGAKRCRIVVLDEQDKIKEKLGREEGADYLAGERTKQVANKKIPRGSTPTKESAGIWPHLMRSDLRRRFLCCPHCNATGRHRDLLTAGSITEANLKGWFVLVKDEKFTVLSTKFHNTVPIPLAKLRWDKEAKRRDGTWDEERIIRSARFECPHCAGHVLDHHRLALDKNGVWLPTQLALRHRGYHLPSFYAPHIDFDSSWGGMAKKFINAYDQGKIQGYINSDLAEVHVSQEHGTNKIELTGNPLAQPDWVPVLTADFHKNWPYIWFVARKWCAFKLLPPFTISNGRPDFAALLELPENAEVKKQCETLVGGHEPAWLALAELMRFKSGEGRSPLVDFLLAQKITGKKLVKLYREDADGNTLEFRRVLYRELSLHASGGKDPARIVPAKGGDSELIAAGHLALSGEYVWDELKEIIAHFHIGQGLPVPGRCVGIDCGYAEKFNREVLRKCHESGTVFKHYDPLSKNRPAMFYQSPIHAYCQPCAADGWLAMKGYPMNQRWNHGGIKNELNLNIEDPFFGTAAAGTAVAEVLEFPSGLFWLRKEDFRRQRTKQVYSVSPAVEFFPKNYDATGKDTGESNFKLADYERHLNEQFYDEAKSRVEPRHGRGGSQSRAHPYHLDDCETMQFALASHHEFFEVAAQNKT